jgi:peptidoglycan/LPS O-acetylase OafA/YrhL
LEKNTKITSLDVLRGLACFAVLLHHVFMINPFFLNSYQSTLLFDSFFMNLLTFTPLKFIWDGHAAVILFFVLSGFVLSISFFKNDSISYKKYFIKRICRIYFPYVFLILIGSLGSNYFQNYERLLKFTDVINSQWINNVSLGTFFNYIFFLDNNIVYLSNSIWSLPVELKVSLVLPFVIIFF